MVMTALARRIAGAPMAPYTDILLSMKPKGMIIVMDFLQEAIQEAVPKEKALSAEDVIRKKFRGLAISDETKELVHGLSLSSEEMSDERTQHFWGYGKNGAHKVLSN